MPLAPDVFPNSTRLLVFQIFDKDRDKVYVLRYTDFQKLEVDINIFFLTNKFALLIYFVDVKEILLLVYSYLCFYAAF